jgi:hypothetical protein
MIEQRCWVHKTANVRSKLSMSQQPKAKRSFHDVWLVAAGIKS